MFGVNETIFDTMFPMRLSLLLNAFMNQGTTLRTGI